MGWQDVIGSMLVAGATGNPMAYHQNKLEQAFKQVQMQNMMDALRMQKDMHDIEKRKLDILLKQKESEEEVENSPAARILKIFGVNLPEGAENITTRQMKYAAPIAQIFQKQEDEYAPIPGTTALFKKRSGEIKETGLQGKPEKESWIDWGYGQKKNVITGEIAKVPTAPRESSTGVFDKNISIAAQAAGVDPQKVKSGKLSIEEANKVADKYKEIFGTASLLQALLGGTLGGQQPTIKYDEKGNVIK